MSSKTPTDTDVIDLTAARAIAEMTNECLDRHWPKVEAIAAALSERKKLDGGELETLFHGGDLQSLIEINEG